MMFLLNMKSVHAGLEGPAIRSFPGGGFLFFNLQFAICNLQSSGSPVNG
jgi:hypothetical protein